MNSTTFVITAVVGAVAATTHLGFFSEQLLLLRQKEITFVCFLFVIVAIVVAAVVVVAAIAAVVAVAAVKSTKQPA